MLMMTRLIFVLALLLTMLASPVHAHTFAFFSVTATAGEVAGLEIVESLTGNQYGDDAYVLRRGNFLSQPWNPSFPSNVKVFYESPDLILLSVVVPDWWANILPELPQGFLPETGVTYLGESIEDVRAAYPELAGMEIYDCLTVEGEPATCERPILRGYAW
jgi:hypothetical protein